MPSPVHPVRSHPSYTYATILQSHNPAPPPSTVHLRNLTFALPIGANPWGPSVKPNQNFHQPILLSARVVLRHAFDTASATDTVDASTIHYGILSKSILKCVEEVKGRGDWPMWSVSDFLDWLVWRLTGIDCISNVDVQKTRSERDLEEPALLQPSRMRELEFSVCLKKGSLKAAAIVLTKRYAFLTEGESEVCTSSVLKLEGIRISTLIGVNANERTATQTVEACVEIDPYACVREDYYPQLEDIVFRTIEESSFETLETLVQHIRDRVVRLFLRPYGEIVPSNQPIHVRISLEKPSAVTFADAPVVELVHVYDPIEEDQMSGWRVPFPLPMTKTLSQYLANHEQYRS